MKINISRYTDMFHSIESKANFLISMANIFRYTDYASHIIYVNNNDIERLRIEKYINFFLYRNKLRTDKTVNINKDIIIYYPTQKIFLYLIRGDISDINFKYFAGVVGFVYLYLDSSLDTNALNSILNNPDIYKRIDFNK